MKVESCLVNRSTDNTSKSRLASYDVALRRKFLPSRSLPVADATIIARHFRGKLGSLDVFQFSNWLYEGVVRKVVYSDIFEWD